MLILSLSSAMNDKSSTPDHAKLFQMYFLDDLALVPSHLDVEMVVNYRVLIYTCPKIPS